MFDLIMSFLVMSAAINLGEAIARTFNPQSDLASTPALVCGVLSLAIITLVIG